LSISEKARRSLQELGLTDSEIRAFMALLQAGSATANIVSEVSGVPYSKIHEVLGGLEKKGWVEVEHGRPSRYYPRPPSVALDTTKLQTEARLRRNEAIILEELQPLYERGEVREHPDIWIVRGELNVLSKATETLGHATREILLAFPKIPDEIVEGLLPALRDASKKGIRVHVMTTDEVSMSSLDELGRVCEVRVKGKMFGGGLVIDEREVLLLLGEDEGKRVVLAIWSDHVGLAKFAKNYFDHLWRESNSVIPRKSSL